MTISPAGLIFIRKHEGCELEAYLDSVGVATIGYGNTQYPSGKKVQIGDTIPLSEADTIFNYFATEFAARVNNLVKSKVNQRQFDALVALAYNIGIGGFSKSTVLKLVNINPDDSAIRRAFMLWNKGTKNGKRIVLPGLTNRRRDEADHYFS